MSAPGAVRAWFDLSRAGNFPSVASNVLAALVLAVPAGTGAASAFPPVGPLLGAVLAGVLVYAGGAMFNDVFDAQFDARRRPERPIPRGLVSRTSAGVVATLLLAAGLALLVAGGAAPVAAAALAATILLYDWLHKKSAATVMLMAGCRVALAAALATGPGREFTAAWLGWVTALFVYIVALSLLARAEYRPGAPAAKIGRAVGGLLAFIPFVDAAALAIVGAWGPAVVCALAVPAGKAAQRLAAAT